MQRHAERTRKRIGQLVDVLKEKIYSEKRSLNQLLVSPATERISYQEAGSLSYRPAKLGEQFGPLWTTYWFQGDFDVPAKWAGKRIDLIWIAHYCESTLWMDGKAIQALNFSFGERSEATLVKSAKEHQKIEFKIEMACNTTYGVWPPEKPYSNISPYVIDKCEIGLFDQQAWKIYIDFLVLQQLEGEIAARNSANEKAFGAHLLYELNRFANEYDPHHVRTWSHAHKILLALLVNRNGSTTHEFSAVGEGHLDVAWMWPLAETWRKVIRTAANQVALLDLYPEYRFVFSQACLYNELKQRLPELYERVKAKIASEKWIPVGGSWVEPDCNLPSGESLARQFLFGQRFFEREFGARASECWLQDAFGFNGQMPQIMTLAGIRRFVSQKLLWVDIRPPHRLFLWEGIDGSRVLAHIAERETFSQQMTIAALTKAASQYSDDDRSARSLLSFGLGDGGGGPTPQMIEMIARLKDLQGAPRTAMHTPAEFFEAVGKDLKYRPPLTWLGELYFARHRGTFTSQSATKKAMRQAEILLHDTEVLSAITFKLGHSNYPQEEINRLWQTVLLNQFHDILPGTSIGQVHEEAVDQLNAVKTECERLRFSAVNSLAQTSESETRLQNSLDSSKKNLAESTLELPTVKKHHHKHTATKEREVIGSGVTPINTIGFNRNEVTETPDGTVVLVEAPSYGVGRVVDHKIKGAHVAVLEINGRISLENENLIAELSVDGELLRLFDKKAGREALGGPGNRLQIFEDTTVDYDAWELEQFHQESFEDCPPAYAHQASDNGLRSEVVFERKIGQKSFLRQAVRLEAQASRLEFHCEVNWQEEHKILKVLFPVSVLATNATYEMQFGAVERPNHYNTPYDQARFEVPGHKWVDLSEHGFGVALLTDCKYGYSVFGNEMRISLLRAPKAPDPQADMGNHQFAYAVMPHRGRWQDAQVVAEAFKFNYPVVWTGNRLLQDEMHSFATVDDPNLVLDTIKKAEDSNDLVLRLYECHGTRGVAKLTLGFPFKAAQYANILEDRAVSATVTEDAIHIPYRPFEIITLIVS